MFATIGYILPEYWRRDLRWLFKWVLDDLRCFHEAWQTLKPPEPAPKRFPGYLSKFLDIKFADVPNGLSAFSKASKKPRHGLNAGAILGLAADRRLCRHRRAERAWSKIRD